MLAAAGVDESGVSILASRWVQAIRSAGLPAELMLRRGERHPDEEPATEFHTVPAAVDSWASSASKKDRLVVVGLPSDTDEARATLAALARVASQATVLWERAGVSVLELAPSLGIDIPRRLRIATLNTRLVPQLQAQIPDAQIVSAPLVLPAIAFEEHVRQLAEPPFAIAVGRITSRKRSLELATAWVDRIGPELGLKLLMLGSGYRAPDSEEQEVTRLATTSEWLECRHLGPLIDRLTQIQAASCAIFASMDDHLPQALAETMAAGTPAIVTPIDAHLALVRDGQTGFVLAGTSLDDLSQTIKRTIDQPGVARHVASNAASNVRELFSIDAAGKHVLAAIGGLA